MDTNNMRKKYFIMLFCGVLGILLNFLCYKFDIDPKMVLPIHLFAMIASFFLPYKLAILMGILPATISSILGMPPFLNDGLFLIFECIATCVTISILYRKFELPTIVSILFGILAGKIAICIVAFVLAGFFGFDENPVKFALDMTILGLPGIIGQLFVIPLAIYGTNNYTTLGID